MIPRHHILTAFELRFDHASAHVVLAQSLDAVGLPDRAEYEPRDVRALALGLLALGHGRIAGVVEALDLLASEPTPEGASKGPAAAAKPQGPAAAGTPAKVAGKAATGGRRG